MIQPFEGQEGMKRTSRFCYYLFREALGFLHSEALSTSTRNLDALSAVGPTSRKNDVLLRDRHINVGTVYQDAVQGISDAFSDLATGLLQRQF